jgi:RNA polymerase sigma-70 factor (ECF subfamily)
MEERATHDLHLVRATLEGDQAAFGRLVERYQKLVASIAWRYGIRREEIEDVVSEVFVKAFRNLHRFRPEHAFSTWLYRLAANHVIDHGRRERRERGRSEMPQQLADTAPSAGERLERRELSRLVRAALEQLPAHYRNVLFLVYIEGLKIDEAARTLQLPQGTIKTRLMRGREGLRKILARTCPDYFGGSHALS